MVSPSGFHAEGAKRTAEGAKKRNERLERFTIGLHTQIYKFYYDNMLSIELAPMNRGFG